MINCLPSSDVSRCHGHFSVTNANALSVEDATVLALIDSDGLLIIRRDSHVLLSRLVFLAIHTIINRSALTTVSSVTYEEQLVAFKCGHAHMISVSPGSGSALVYSLVAIGCVSFIVSRLHDSVLDDDRLSFTRSRVNNIKSPVSSAISVSLNLCELKIAISAGRVILHVSISWNRPSSELDVITVMSVSDVLETLGFKASRIHCSCVHLEVSDTSYVSGLSVSRSIIAKRSLVYENANIPCIHDLSASRSAESPCSTIELSEIGPVGRSRIIRSLVIIRVLYEASSGAVSQELYSDSSERTGFTEINLEPVRISGTWLIAISTIGDVFRVHSAS